MRVELEKKAVLLEEERGRREAQHAAELKALRKELREAESQQLTLQKEILVLRDKLDKTRRERCVWEVGRWTHLFSDRPETGGAGSPFNRVS